MKPGQFSSEEWWPERIAALRRLVDDGNSAGQVAAALSQAGAAVTRNMVIGKCKRLGLRLRGKPPDKARGKKLPPVEWDEARNATLRQAVESGLSLRAVIADLERRHSWPRKLTEPIVRAQISRQGLGGHGRVSLRGVSGGRSGTALPPIDSRHTMRSVSSSAALDRRHRNNPSRKPGAGGGKTDLPDVDGDYPDRVDLFDARADQCRWPLWPSHWRAGEGHRDVCGAAVCHTENGRQSYCAAHYADSTDRARTTRRDQSLGVRRGGTQGLAKRVRREAAE